MGSLIGACFPEHTVLQMEHDCLSIYTRILEHMDVVSFPQVIFNRWRWNF